MALQKMTIPRLSPEIMRTAEQAARLRLLQAGSLAEAEADRIQAVESYLADCPGLSASVWVNELAPGIDPARLCLVEDVHRIAEAVVHLACLRHVMPGIASPDESLWAGARETYVQLLRRALAAEPFREAGLEPVAAHFLKESMTPMPLPEDLEAYRHQLHRRLGITTIAPLALSRLERYPHTARLQLLLQSIRWAYTAFYLPAPASGEVREAAWRNAMQLTRSISVPVYQAWLLDMRTDSITAGKSRWHA